MRIGRTDCNHYSMRSERLWKLLCVFCTLRPNPDTLKMLYQILAIKFPGLRASMVCTQKPGIYSSSRNTRVFRHSIHAQKGNLASSWVKSRDEE
jgi:hypothetical protein